jgi:hypothetical protein
MRYSNEFYFVTPPDLVRIAEIPPECGLVEAGYVTFAEWKHLIRRHARLFNYDPETRAIAPSPARTVARYSRADVATSCGHDAEPAPRTH